MSELARKSPSTARNRQPILEVLRPRLNPGARVLEIASGAGEHAAYFAESMPSVRWRPSDPDADARSSIVAWKALSGLANLAGPIALDASQPDLWPDDPVDAIVCINMVHISPWEATVGLMRGAGRLLPLGGQLFLYGPYLEADRPTEPSNLAFDESLKARNPRWGLRDLAEVETVAAANGLRRAERIEMPANNLIVVFEKR